MRCGPARSGSPPRGRSTTAPAGASRRRPSPRHGRSWSASPRAVGETGAGVLQVVSDFPDFDAEVGTMREMVRRSGRPLSVSLMQIHARPDAWRDVLDAITQANADGLTMRAQVAARGDRHRRRAAGVDQPAGEVPELRRGRRPPADGAGGATRRALAARQRSWPSSPRRRGGYRLTSTGVFLSATARLRARSLGQCRRPGRRATASHPTRCSTTCSSVTVVATLLYLPITQLLRRQPRRGRRAARPPPHRPRPR